MNCLTATGNGTGMGHACVCWDEQAEHWLENGQAWTRYLKGDPDCEQGVVQTGGRHLGWGDHLLQGGFPRYLLVVI